METFGTTLITLGFMGFFFGFGDMLGTNKPVVAGSVVAIIAGALIHLIGV
jgi:hypothetical protein